MRDFHFLMWHYRLWEIFAMYWNCIDYLHCRDNDGSIHLHRESSNVKMTQRVAVTQCPWPMVKLQLNYSSWLPALKLKVCTFQHKKKLPEQMYNLTHKNDLSFNATIKQLKLVCILHDGILPVKLNQWNSLQNFIYYFG